MNAVLSYFDGIASLRGWPRVRRGAAIILLMWLPCLPINYLADRYLPVREVGSQVGSLLEIITGLTLLPLAETYVMRLELFLLRKLSQNMIFVCVVSAILWGFFHALRYWGLYAVWPFFVMSYCYLRLEKNSVTQAMVVSTLLHGAANAYAAIVALGHMYFFT